LFVAVNMYAVGLSFALRLGIVSRVGVDGMKMQVGLTPPRKQFAADVMLAAWLIALALGRLAVRF
jgi:hypothetical protein